MHALLNASLSSIWSEIEGLENLKTPDNSKGKSFTVLSVTPERVTISSEAGSPIVLHRSAFLETLRYLVVNSHDSSHPCEIESNQKAEDAGPLCVASRTANNNTRVINYIVPILARFSILGVSGDRPNKTWLA